SNCSWTSKRPPGSALNSTSFRLTAYADDPHTVVSNSAIHWRLRLQALSRPEPPPLTNAVLSRVSMNISATLFIELFSAQFCVAVRSSHHCRWGRFPPTPCNPYPIRQSCRDCDPCNCRP